MAENNPAAKHPWGKRRYASVVEGCAMAAQFRRSGLTIGEFTRQTGVSRSMVLYWTQRERELAASAQAGFVEVTPAIEAVDTEAQAAPVITPPAVIARSEPAKSPKAPSPAAPIPPPAAIAEAPRSLVIRLPGGAVIVVDAGFDPSLLRAVVGCLVPEC